MEEKIKIIKEKALADNIPIIMDDTLAVIKEILLEKKPKMILEIGTAIGYSAICFSNILNNEVCIDTIELDEIRAHEAICNISNLKLEGRISVLIGDAVEILPGIDKLYDVVFIDASKSKYPVFLEHAIRLTGKNSVIIADNVLFKGYVLGNYSKHKQRTTVNRLREYLEMVNSNPSVHTEILEVGDGLAVSCRV